MNIAEREVIQITLLFLKQYETRKPLQKMLAPVLFDNLHKSFTPA